jgi:hypothetical protein
MRLAWLTTLYVHPSSAVAVADPPATTETSRVGRIPDAINLNTDEELHQSCPPAATCSPSRGEAPQERSTTMTINDRPDDEIGDLLTLHEVAELLRVPEATLRYW